MDYFDAEIKLQALDEELIADFKKLKNFNDISKLLEVTPKHLHYILFKKKNLYHEFDIPKSNGGTRRILAPCESLKILQQKLNYIMSLIYKPKYPVHSFVKGKGIVSNARRHLRKKNILNFDLQDFFTSINFGRVRGILKGYFGMSDDAATIIANICCFNNSLPQGAPTSPILSNLVCFNLDKDFEVLARHYSCTYTRYADDITFSTTEEKFPELVAYKYNNQVVLGEKVIRIIKKNGFEINDSKTRLRYKTQNLSVTGITVNEKLNVQRNYIKKIRAMLRCLETNTQDDAREIFLRKYKFRYNPNKETPNVMNVLHGMINYVGMVRGNNDSIFKKLAVRYNKIEGAIKISVNDGDSSLWEQYVYVIEIGYEYEGAFYAERQGTGFFLKNIGFVTNAHVIEGHDNGSLNAIYSHRSRYSNMKAERTTVLRVDSERDIAILQIEGYDIDFGFDYNTNNAIGQEIILLGYPNYGEGDSLYTYKGQLVQYRSHFMQGVYNKETQQLGLRQERITISPRIVTGNSGGPIINIDNEVIGIATKGFKETSQSNDDDSTAESIIVKIEDVLALK